MLGKNIYDGWPKRPVDTSVTTKNRPARCCYWFGVEVFFWRPLSPAGRRETFYMRSINLSWFLAPNSKEISPVPIYLFLLSFANDHNDSILVRLDTQSESYVQSYVTAIQEWISRMHEHRLTAFALRCSIRATATEMVAIAP